MNMEIELLFMCLFALVVGINSHPKHFFDLQDPSNEYLEGTWKEESDITFDLVGRSSTFKISATVECNAQLNCAFKEYQKSSSIDPNKWKSYPLTKNMKGPFQYRVIGSSVSVTKQGKTVTGTFDGKGRIIWPTSKYLPNGSTWTKIDDATKSPPKA